MCDFHHNALHLFSISLNVGNNFFSPSSIFSRLYFTENTINCINVLILLITRSKESGINY